MPEIHQRIILSTLLFLILFLVRGTAWSAEQLNCHPYYGNVQERYACAILQFNKADHQLNVVYQDLMHQQPKDVALAIRKEQRAWLSGRDVGCHYPANYRAKSDAEYKALFNECRASQTISRTIQLRSYASVLTGYVPPPKPKPLHIPGETSEARLTFLGKLPDDTPAAHAARMRYMRTAVEDPSPKVRAIAAFYLRGNGDIVTLIHLMAHDPDPGVRHAAGRSLDHWLTDNGTETCNGAEQVAPYIEELLHAAKDRSTAASVVGIFGYNYSGELSLTCCMPPRQKKQILDGLAVLADEKSPIIKKMWDQFRRSGTAATFGIPGFAVQAIRNSNQCIP